MCAKSKTCFGFLEVSNRLDDHIFIIKCNISCDKDHWEIFLPERRVYHGWDLLVSGTISGKSKRQNGKTQRWSQMAEDLKRNQEITFKKNVRFRSYYEVSLVYLWFANLVKSDSYTGPQIQ